MSVNLTWRHFIPLLLLLRSSLAALEMVVVLSRHAARAPLNFVIYPGLFHEKRGDITHAGLRQAYLMGRYLRKAYVKTGFLDPTKHHDELYVKASSVQRCYLTAVGQVYGLLGHANDRSYPQDTNEAVQNPLYKLIGSPPFWKKEEEDELMLEEEGSAEIARYSFPTGMPAVHVRVTNEKHSDYFFHAHKSYVCPLVGETQKKIKDTEFFRNYSRAVLTEISPPLAEVLNSERNALGVEDIHPAGLTLRRVKRIYDGYKVNSFHKARIPPLPRKLLKRLHEIQFFYVYHVKYGDHFIKRATVSELFREMHELIVGRLLHQTVSHKLLLYSAHDSNLEGFLSLLLSIEELRSSPDFLPPFGSMISMEIHKREEAVQTDDWMDAYYVKFLFNKRLLRIKMCDEKEECPLGKLLHFLEKNQLPNLAELCHSHKVSHNPHVKKFSCPAEGC